MPPLSPDRRQFLKSTAAASIATAGPALAAPLAATPLAQRPDYTGPNVVFVRFGGGARRRESIAPDGRTYSPFVRDVLAPQGVLFPDMQIATDAKATSHGEGTLNLLTGVYDEYADVEGRLFGARFEARKPTLFEYLRRSFNVPEHQTLIVNGEDRTQEEFYTFSNHHNFGVTYRSEVLSLFRFKSYLLRKQIEELSASNRRIKHPELAEKQKQLAEMDALDYRIEAEARRRCAEIDRFWAAWRQRYGDSGLTCPRGDRLLTELAVWAVRRLRPKLMMINYNDCDYVHWGNLSHYTSGIAIMDRGIRRLWETINADQAYRDNTVMVIVPDCGRDDSRLAAVPCQHHFNTRAAREIFALVVGAGIDRGRVVDRPVEQNQVAATVAQIMGTRATHADGPVLEEAFA